MQPLLSDCSHVPSFYILDWLPAPHSRLWFFPELPLINPSRLAKCQSIVARARWEACLQLYACWILRDNIFSFAKFRIQSNSIDRRARWFIIPINRDVCRLAFHSIYENHNFLIRIMFFQVPKRLAWRVLEHGNRGLALSQVFFIHFWDIFVTWNPLKSVIFMGNWQ